MNKIFEGKWDQMKGKLRQEYGDLTDDELETAKGNREELVGKLKEKYGKTRQEIEQQLDRLAQKLND